MKKYEPMSELKCIIIIYPLIGIDSDGEFLTMLKFKKR